jgi:spermidine synthase
VTQFRETLFPHHGQWFDVGSVVYEVRTEHQHLIIFENASYGRVMALDGIIQTTERDEFVYHEMLAHVPLLAHGSARRVLIVGGGDGGMAREVARHQDVESITQVEIDRAVVDMCREHLPRHSAGVFDDPRLDLVIADGLDFVRQTDRRFDVVVSDSTDPIGPGEALFGESFYAGCKRCLAPGGVLVAQNGVPFEQPDEIRDAARRLAGLFTDTSFYAAAVPTYVGGVMAFAWASDDAGLRGVPLDTLRRRFEATGIDTRYYTPEVHLSAFSLPRYVLDAIS